MTVVLKLLGTLVSLGAGLAATHLLGYVWKMVTGRDAPQADDDLENSVASALVFAVVSGTVGRVIQVLLKRATAKAVLHYEKTPEIV
ncbi:DUF4235 domain-containing protein [Arthrobacter sulfonylureivorans]|jgi:hypothetical protein|uniref:DUF4235 domain-containing protein n=1 Tax=Arthrobacter sulfonylureivorans TaxID=2486855 RepID=A0ABY3WAL0_9MICC|nr:DUF4235 domain-containing protein [Arthrobacter sulfonylureivorans]UNK46511.1 DUF4235 domain-containing protein [Arthrobacter sulfonylureivorans]